ncbi:hypothetical protein [Mucisphaera sp.]|uniref:hypothetical protein n=1 Tax=Mucisphaera sp. TaxID=2913024 RepID=UPI003D0FB6FB
MRHWHSLAAGLSVLILVETMASAGVILNYQTRTLTASAGDAAGTQSQQVSAAGFGLYDDLLTFSYTGTEFGGGGTGVALQTSQVLPWVISGEGTGTGSGGGGVGTGFAGGSSYLEVGFTVTEPIDYSLNGFISADSGFNHASVVLSGPDGVIAEEEVGEFVGFFGGVLFTGPEGYWGTLTPGDYTITAVATANDGSFSGPEAIFDFSLRVPEPSSMVVGLGVLCLVLRRLGR